MGSWWTAPGRGLRIGGHRGDPSRAPENTLAGFELAVEAGADYVELDVHLARDGVLVVIHDEELGRTIDGAGAVADLTSGELGELDAGSWFDPRFGGERVPLLAEVLALLEAAGPRGGAGIAAVVEAKGPGTGGQLARVLGASAIRERLAICSFDAEELLAAASTDPRIPTMLIVDRDRPELDPAALAAACGARIVNVPASWLGPEDVRRLSGAGLLVAGGTGDDEATVRHAVAIGLDAIDSNAPAAAVAWRNGASAARVAERAASERGMAGRP